MLYDSFNIRAVARAVISTTAPLIIHPTASITAPLRRVSSVLLLGLHLILINCGLGFNGNKTAPLVSVCFGRSGDKSSDCNVGLFVKDSTVWDWLRSFLTIAKVKELLNVKYKGGQIERFEMPHLHAVRFLLKDHLDRGCNPSSSYDTLGKNYCEYLRAKHVDNPRAFLGQ